MRTFLKHVINSVLIEVSVRLESKDVDIIKDDSWRLRNCVVQRRRGIIEDTFLMFVYTHTYMYL